MTKEITPRQRVMTALHSGKPDKIPFTIYKGIIFHNLQVKKN